MRPVGRTARDRASFTVRGWLGGVTATATYLSLLAGLWWTAGAWLIGTIVLAVWVLLDLRRTS